MVGMRRRTCGTRPGGMGDEVRKTGSRHGFFGRKVDGLGRGGSRKHRRRDTFRVRARCEHPVEGDGRVVGVSGAVLPRLVHIFPTPRRRCRQGGVDTSLRVGLPFRGDACRLTMR